MTLERKEMDFWTSVDKEPPFIKECKMDWRKMVEEYHETLRLEEDAIFQEENNKYLQALENLTKEDIEKFEDDGTIPSELTKIVQINSDMYFKFIKLPHMSPTTGGYVFDDIALQDNSELEYEEKMYDNA
jgi:hypothetical protein